MSDRSDLRMNRRRLLLAMSTVGAVGTLTGRGAAAYLTDRETLADNRMTAGAVTLTLDGADAARTTLGFTIDDYGFEHRDEATVCLGLDEASNPAWVWVRACPVPDIADELRARLAVNGETVDTDSLGALLSGLGNGALLSTLAGGSTVPTEPGGDGAVCLRLAVWAPETLAGDPDTVRALKAASPFTVTLDAYAEQSRHVPTPRRPVGGLNPSFTFPACEPTERREREDEGPGRAISNVSLCTSTPLDPAAITLTTLDPDTGAAATDPVTEPFAVRIESAEPIQYAVVGGGGEFRRFDVGGAATFVVTSTGGTRLDVRRNFANCACEHEALTFDWDDDAGAFGPPTANSCGGDANGSPATPDPPGDGPSGGDDNDDPPGGPPAPTRRPSDGTGGGEDAPETTGGGRPSTRDDR
jgi:hypothetical protein